MTTQNIADLSVLGAIDVALGSGATGVFTNSTEMWDLLQKVSRIRWPHSTHCSERCYDHILEGFTFKLFQQCFKVRVNIVMNILTSCLKYLLCLLYKLKVAICNNNE